MTDIRTYVHYTVWDDPKAVKAAALFQLALLLVKHFAHENVQISPTKRRITLSCQICHRPFTVRAKLSEQKYCSRSCRTIGIGKTESSIEKAFAGALTSVALSYHAQFAFGPYIIDFAFPEKRIAIECDGDYWHSQPACILRDKRKDKFLLNRGWRVLRFSETEINTDLAGCLTVVQQALSQ